MQEFLLNFDKSISLLEKENKWNKAAEFLWEQWKNNKSDINCLLCVGTQLWYTYIIMDDIQEELLLEKEKVVEKELLDRLMCVTRYGLEIFENNAIFNAYFGYMISVMPYLFNDYDGDYDGWQEKGIEMMRKAYRLDPTNPFCEAMNYERASYSLTTCFEEACKKIWSKITPLEWGDSEVQQYFFRILRGDLYYDNAYSHDK